MILLNTGKNLRHDTAKEVKEVSYSQEKGKEESTIITVTWDDEHTDPST